MKTREKSLRARIKAEKKYVSWRNFNATKQRREINTANEMKKK